MAIGDIGSVLDTLEFDPGLASRISICHVSGEVYAIVFQGVDSDGWLCTFSVNSAGAISAAIIDSYEFDATQGYYTQILKASDGIYLIAYAPVGSAGKVISVAIADDGTITKSIIDSLEFSSYVYFIGNIVKVGAGFFGIVHNDSAFDGWVKTFSCNASGDISATVIDSLEFDISQANDTWFCQVSGTIYAVVYRGPGDDGYIKTFSIDSAGNIGAAVIDSLEFDPTNCFDPSICKARSYLFAVAYRGVNNDGWIKIIYIDSLGNITDPVKDSYEFDAANGWWPFVIPLSQGYLAVAYSQGAGAGILKTFLCDAAGHLNSTTIDTLVFDSTRGGDPSFIHTVGDIYLIAYTGPDADGWVCSVDIETPVVGFPQHLMMIGIG